MRADRTAQIPDGKWQGIAAIVLIVLALPCALAATPFNSAGAFSDVFFALAGTAFFWSAMLRYFSLIERKIDRLSADPAQ